MVDIILTWIGMVVLISAVVSVFAVVWLIMNAGIGGRKAPEFEPENETWVSVEVFVPGDDSRGRR